MSIRASIQHPLGNDPTIPKWISELRLLELTKSLREGRITFTEREELARGFIRLALKIAASWANNRPQKADDIASAALFGIVYALDKAREKLIDDNLTGWVIAAIVSHCRRFCAQDHLAVVPAKTYHTRQKKGLSTPTLTIVPIDFREIEKRCYTSTGTVHEIKEMLKISAKDDRDREIIRLRIQGYDDREIGAKLNISQQAVHMRRKDLESRYQRLESV